VGVCNAATPTSTFHTKLTANTLDQNNVQHSWSSLALGDCKNLIDNANFTNNQIANTCVPQAFNIQGEDGGEPIEESFDLEHSIDVINDSVNYSEYPAMAKWFDERALLNQLSTQRFAVDYLPYYEFILYCKATYVNGYTQQNRSALKQTVGYHHHER
jgi:hypothetical protein